MGIVICEILEKYHITDKNDYFVVLFLELG